MNQSRIEYWNKRFRNEPHIWSDNPSISVIYAAKIFKENNLKTILVPGCSYGRNSIYLLKEGLIVTAFDFSPIALKIANEIVADLDDIHVKYYEGDALREEDYDGIYDGIYASNLLHLFLKSDREKLITNFERVLREGGIMALNVFSPEDSSYGEGELVEENTYYSNDGHLSHFFTEEELVSCLTNFRLITVNKIREFESHGEKGDHFHNFLFVAFKKSTQGGK